MNEDLKSQLVKIGKDAQKASHILSMANEDTKNSALTNMADLIDSNSNEIIESSFRRIKWKYRCHCAKGWQKPC